MHAKQYRLRNYRGISNQTKPLRKKRNKSSKNWKRTSSLEVISGSKSSIWSHWFRKSVNAPAVCNQSHRLKLLLASEERPPSELSLSWGLRSKVHQRQELLMQRIVKCLHLSLALSHQLQHLAQKSRNLLLRGSSNILVRKVRNKNQRFLALLMLLACIMTLRSSFKPYKNYCLITSQW